MRAPWRKEFSSEREFQVRRKFTCSGRSFAPGEQFDKTLISTRRLRQLYDQRVLVFWGDTPGALLLAKRNRRNRPHVALPEELEPEAPGQDPDPRDAIAIPENWRSMPWFQRKALCASLSDAKVVNAGDAERVITAELERRGNP